jgi:hypothetical protein
MFDRKMKSRQPQNEDQLFHVVREACNNIDIGYLQKLVDSMPHRIQVVIDAKGYMTKY